MRLIQKLLALASFSLMAICASASPSDPVEGVEFQRLPQAQPTEAGKKIEVLEFFWYGCPHCFAFEPALSDWVKKRGDQIVFKRIPVGFRDSFVPQQKLYFALEALNRFDVHKAYFEALHIGRQRLDKDDLIVDFVEKQGIDRKKFLDVYNSFSVQSKVSRVRQMQEAYRIEGVPTIVIDGQYVTSPSIVGAKMRGQPEAAMNMATLQVMDALINRKK